MRPIRWTLAVLGVLAVAGVVAFAAGAFGGTAQAQEPSGERKALHERYRELLAERLGVSVGQLDAAMKAARDQMIDEAAATGRITAEQAERLRNFQRPKMTREKGQRVRAAVLNVIETAAQVLGLSQRELGAELRQGKSLNAIAAERGVANLEAQLIAQLTAQVQARVADGTLTQAQADRLLENLAARVSQMTEREFTRPERSPSPPMPRMR